MAGELYTGLRIAVDDGVELRPLGLEDAELVYSIIAAERERLSEWLPWPGTIQSASDEASFIRTSLGQLAMGEGMACAIVTNRTIAGGIGLHKTDYINQSTEIGYWLAAGFVGRGLMSRSTQALTTFAFEALGLHRVVIRASTGNARSRAIPMRLGFVHEGTQRDAELLNGEFVDLEVYSMLSTEWVPSAHS